MQIDNNKYYPEKAKLGEKGASPRSRDILLNFGTPYISGTAEDTNFKFGVRIDYNKYYPKKAKLGERGRGLGHVTYFRISGALYI